MTKVAITIAESAICGLVANRDCFTMGVTVRCSEQRVTNNRIKHASDYGHWFGHGYLYQKYERVKQ